MNTSEWVTDEQKNGQQEISHKFYKDALEILNESRIPYLLAGAFALRHYTGVYRNTKDLDVFCKASDYTDIVKVFAEKGYKTEIVDSRWLAKAWQGDFFVDIIFSNTSNLNVIDDGWIENSEEGEVFGVKVPIIGAEDLIWSKMYVQNRERYDGADINHMILRCGNDMDWKKIMNRLKQHWQLLLSQLLNFQFVYPSDRDIIPKWVMDELLQRAQEQYDLPLPQEKVCLGPLIDHQQYNTDIMQWGYKCITSSKF